ncbi:MAG TPA: NERD domain-containing protein, partial [Thermoleophilia bacterium]|nr:NERD domain-containing protein [Thermoleophilia bacterium]
MRLIPPTIPDDGVSEGERLVFETLARASDTEGWVVMHSLDLSHHRRRLAGEIDFLVIVPGKGVLVLEVKGVHRLRRSDGLWFYGNDRHPDDRGPFKQASEAMHSLHDQLARGQYHRRHAETSGADVPGHDGDHRKLTSIPFWSAVCFPFIEFDERSEEWHPWQVIDRRALSSRPLAALCEHVLDEARRLLTERREPWFRPDLHEPTPAQVDELATILRGDFELFESPKSRSRRLDDEVRRYTEEQFEALDAVDGNPRIVFDGPAGTGKTLLAVEVARRAAQQGRRVLLLCFNRPLGRWLQDETADLRPAGPPGATGSPAGPGVVTRTIHEHMRLLAGIEVTEAQRDSSAFWQEELPERAGLALLEAIERAAHAEPPGVCPDVYDEIVLDEVQDVLRPSYLEFLDLSLRDGLVGGTYRFFGDFGWQRIYDAAALSLDELVGPGGPCAGAVRYELRVNCRNTPRVADLACECGGVVPGYARVRRPDDQIEPDIRFW